MNTKTNEDLDQELCDFVARSGSEAPDLSLSGAKLVDDICENGDRKLTPFERHMIQNMMAELKSSRR